MKMRVTYVCRSFLDYRVPVLEELYTLIEGQLTVIFSEELIPARVNEKIRSAIGDKAIGLTGERALGYRGNITSELANSRIRIPWQPGIFEKIRKSAPDVLIGDGFSQWSLPAMVYRLLKGTPIVICYERTAHTERNAQWYRRIFRRSLVPFINAMCVNGRLSREYAESLGMPADKITTGHMVADVEDLQKAVASVSRAAIAELKVQYNLKGLIYLYVGKLIPLKGLDKLLKAWRSFSSGNKADEITLLLVGDGSERRGLESYCEINGLHNVRFAGAVDYDVLAPFFKAANALVIPTLEDNWSLVVPEAMACGLPILCSKYNGCWPELVKPGNGWVFDPLDIDDTVSVLMKCLTERDVLSEMGPKSLEIIGNQTSMHAAQSILQACNIALGN